MIPLAMKNFSAECKFFEGGLMIITHYTHNTKFRNSCFSMNHGRMRKKNINRIVKILFTVCRNSFDF